MNSIIKSLLEKFNSKLGAEAVRLAAENGDSFMAEFVEERHMEEFAEFLRSAVGKPLTVQPIVNPFGASSLARISFGTSEAAEAVELLKRYEEGTPLRGVECCGDGCHHG